jgi:hypothetical protein
MDFEIVGDISRIETIARGSGVRDRARLRRQYGPGRWRKLKGVARIRWLTASYALLKFTGMKRMVLARESSNSNSRFLMNHEEQRQPDPTICPVPR